MRSRMGVMEEVYGADSSRPNGGQTDEISVLPSLDTTSSRVNWLCFCSEISSPPVRTSHRRTDTSHAVAKKTAPPEWNASAIPDVFAAVTPDTCPVSVLRKLMRPPVLLAMTGPAGEHRTQAGYPLVGSVSLGRRACISQTTIDSLY